MLFFLTFLVRRVFHSPLSQNLQKQSLFIKSLKEFIFPQAVLSIIGPSWLLLAHKDS